MMSSPALSRDRVHAFSLNDQAPTGAAPASVPPVSPPAAPAIHRVAGRYRYDPKWGTWWWSPELFALHGLPADSTQASTEVLLQYLHPEDRTRTLAAITGACTEGRPFTVLTRIVRADGQHRTLVLVGEPETGADGQVTAVHGTAVDLTDCAQTGDVPDRTGALEAEVAQMRAAMASRATIEQAKGILMLLTSCSDHVAFDLLAHISSHTHRKVRAIAESITESASGHARLPDDVRAIIRDACPPERPHR
jgi:hypothetical protein